MTIPEKIGRYEIIRELGRGGMATVFLAHDPRFKRDVALKLLPRQFTHDPMFRARFQREGETIAALDHPAIVPVYDFGEEDDQPYLVMRLMTGGSLADRLQKEGAIPLKESAAIVQRVSSALDRAHELGIIHRDLKPENVLFDQYGDAYLADFGIARLTEASATLTGSGIIGTPAYMSPEQIQGGQIDGRTDIYALGIIIYEMLTGEKPYLADTPAMMLVKQMTEPVPRILDVRPDLPPTCESTIARATAKTPADRYDRAGEVAQTLSAIADQPTRPILQEQRPFTPPPAPPLTPEPASQEPPPPPEPLPENGRRRLRGWQWVVVALVACCLLSLCAFVIIGTLGDDETGVERPDLGGNAPAGTAVAIAPLPAESETAAEEAVAVPLPANRITAANAPDLTQVRKLGLGEIFDIAVNPAQDKVAVVGVAGVLLLNADSLQVEKTLVGHDGGVAAVAWSPDGAQLASAGYDQTIRIWDVAQGQQIYLLEGNDEYIRLAWSPDGTQLAATTWVADIELWDVGNGRLAGTLSGHQSFASQLAWKPDEDQRLASADADGTIRYWDTANQEELMAIQAHDGAIFCLNWSPNGEQLASCGEDDAIHIWDGNTGEPLATLDGHEYDAYEAVWTPDGDNIITADGNATIRVWDANSGQLLDIDTELRAAAHRMRWLSHDRLLVVDVDGGLAIYDGVFGEVLVAQPAFVDYLGSLTWSPNSEQLAAASSDDAIRIWQPTQPDAGMALVDQAHDYDIYDLHWSPTGEYLASVGGDGAIRIWDTAEWITTNTWGLDESYSESIDWSFDGNNIAVGDADGGLSVWQPLNNEERLSWSGHDAAISHVRWSPVDWRLASLDRDGIMRIWQADPDGDERELVTLTGYVGVAADIAWSPDGVFLASVGHGDGADWIIIWDTERGEQLTTFRAADDAVTTVAWSPDGSLLASGGWDGRLHLWRTDNWREIEYPASYDYLGDVMALAWSPDGSFLASSHGGQVILWGVGE